MGYPDEKAVPYKTDAEAASNDSQEKLATPIRSWKGYVWDTWELPKDQRWLLFKVDAFVLTFASGSNLPPLPSTLANNESSSVIS